LVVSTWSLPRILPSRPKPLQVVAEVELEIERHRNRGGLARRGRLVADDHHVLAERRHAAPVELEVAAVGAQRSAEREALLDDLGLAAPGRHQAHVGALQQRELFSAP